MQPFQTVPWDQYLENHREMEPKYRKPGKPWKPVFPSNQYFLGHQMDNIIRPSTKAFDREYEFAVMKLWRQWIGFSVRTHGTR